MEGISIGVTILLHEANSLTFCIRDSWAFRVVVGGLKGVNNAGGSLIVVVVCMFTLLLANQVGCITARSRHDGRPGPLSIMELGCNIRLCAKSCCFGVNGVVVESHANAHACKAVV